MKRLVLNKMTGMLCLLLICVCVAGCADQSQTPAGGTTDVASAGDTVQVDYKGYFDDGEVFDSSYDRGQPLEFIVASGGMIPGFDAAVNGMTVGEKKTVRLSPAEAYGEWDETLVETIDISQFGENATPVIGETYYTLTNQGYVQLTVTEIDGDDVTVDKNHPMAGKTLNFDIELVAVVPADA